MRRLLQIQLVLSTGSVANVSRSDKGDLMVDDVNTQLSEAEGEEALKVFEAFEDTLAHGFGE